MYEGWFGAFAASRTPVPGDCQSTARLFDERWSPGASRAVFARPRTLQDFAMEHPSPKVSGVLYV